MKLLLKGLILPLLGIAMLCLALSPALAASQLSDKVSWEIRQLVANARAQNNPGILRVGLEALANENLNSISEIAAYSSSQLTGASVAGSSAIQELAGAIAAGLVSAAPSQASTIIKSVEAKHPQAVAEIFEAVQGSFATAAGTDKQALVVIPQSLQNEIEALIEKARLEGNAQLLETAIKDLIAANPSLALEITTQASEQISQMPPSAVTTSLIASLARGVASAVPELASEVTEIIGSSNPEALATVFEAIQTAVASAAGKINQPTNSLPNIATTIEPSASESASPSS